MVHRGPVVIMQFLQIFYKIIDALRIQELEVFINSEGTASERLRLLFE